MALVVPAPVQRSLKVKIEVDGDTPKQVIIALNELITEVEKGNFTAGYDRPGRKVRMTGVLVDPPGYVASTREEEKKRELAKDPVQTVNSNAAATATNEAPVG